MTVLQVAFMVGITAVLTGWCVHRALASPAPSVASVYRKMYGNSFEERPTATSLWERPTLALGHVLAGMSVAERFAAAKRFELRVADVTLTAVATRIVTAGLVGFVAGVVATTLPLVAGGSIPVWMLVSAPFVIALATGWYQYATIAASLTNRYSDFRAGIAAYISLVSVCLTTRRSSTEAVTYAADVGSGRAFEVIAASVHAAPMMGLQAWEALDAVGSTYGARELEDLATSIGNVASIGVGVESTVVAVAARMRQVGLDDMQRQADRQTASMFAPTMLFVLGTVAFLAYPLAQRVLDAFATTS
jgi:hypothetical protein